ncbi:MULTISPECIES: crotonase/enoyl-CoA hydratase family protein [unclassified Isoptericola]|uniref:crotonase/enoyl-CoA hydratase family protein n=1 Tax=unclassified Isoptericola TaxID=2623355 RepID=UPI002712E9DE|nr:MULTISPECIES: crotonase/enoyl-CoA hydratase family protein [unclassified Isoptericola]MDO8145246.1 crotonase/enoyl-CoA hydratase family protein [Isoptericola sp. 178]MDO8151174.1 crotonase/enoyl-CoA hydratase family protein [Isoptericola sp. b408]
MTDARFDLTRDGGVVTVELAGRDGKPVMDPEFFTELHDTFVELDQDDEARAIVLRGTRGNFSYGLDIAAVAGMFGHFLSKDDADTRQQVHATVRRWQAAMTAVASCRKPTIAAIEGWCLGGGVDLAAACDIRVASADATFSIKEARLAIVADLGSLQRLVGVIGDGHLRQLALTGEDITAERAARIGLVNDVYPSSEELMAAAHALASTIARNSALTMRGIKDVLDAERGPRVEAGLRYVAAWNSAFLASDDLLEAMAAMREGREPTFR